jgi:transcriptional regulator with XRE-family HTH domain
MESIGSRIKARMSELNYTQQRLASETGIDQHKISEFLNNKKSPSIEEFQKLGNALQCDVATLMPYSLLYGSVICNISNSENFTQNYYTIDRDFMKDLLKENGKLMAEFEKLKSENLLLLLQIQQLQEELAKHQKK